MSLMPIDTPLSGRKVKKVPVVTQDGEQIDIPIRELTWEELDCFFAEIQRIQEEAQAMDTTAIESDPSPVGIMRAMSLDLFRQGIRRSEELWRIKTGMADVSWLYRIFPGTLEDLEEVFEQLNLPIRETKKNMALHLSVMDTILAMGTAQEPTIPDTSPPSPEESKE